MSTASPTSKSQPRRQQTPCAPEGLCRGKPQSRRASFGAQLEGPPGVGVLYCAQRGRKKADRGKLGLNPGWQQFAVLAHRINELLALLQAARLGATCRRGFVSASKAPQAALTHAAYGGWMRWLLPTKLESTSHKLAHWTAQQPPARGRTAQPHPAGTVATRGRQPKPPSTAGDAR